MVSSRVKDAAQVPTYVVGIGASAGGLEALEAFFDQLPNDTGMAFVVVQHLSPDFRSLMDELLGRHTQLPIRLVENGMPVEANHVYLIPPRTEMIISEGRLLLSERDAHQDLSLPIDIFFRSLARDCRKRAVAIVLSGGGSDGSRGVRDVVEAGGMVLVQDGQSAQFDGMPRTARDAGVAHRVLAPAAMPQALLDHAGQRKSDSQAPSRAPDPPHAGLAAVYRMLEEEFGIDFNHYKPSTVTRRIQRRVQLALAGDLDGYIERLREHRSELDDLYRDLLIGVTSFFRDEAAYEALEGAMTDVVRNAPLTAPLRAWVAGCATGEEAYSLAIVLHELAARHGGRPVKIFASDVHHGSLEIAARGIYDEDAVKSVSPERLQRYFLRRGKTYQVVPELRELIVFAPHDVIRDAPFTRLDLISCRNLLIYFTPEAQQKVLALFHFGLTKGGVLLLGPSESSGHLVDDLEVIDKHWRLFRKTGDARATLGSRFSLRGGSRPLGEPMVRPTVPSRHSVSQLLATYDALLDEHMPPSLLINDRGELVHAFGGASRFLRRQDGRQGLDVVDMVDGPLRTVLAGSLKRALGEPSGLAFNGLRLDDEGLLHTVTLKPITNRAGAGEHVIVTFEAAGKAVAPPPTHTELALGEATDAQLNALQSELNYTKESLQTAIEELETGNEELQTTNEELHASNEELQSTNEELQSVNEELYSVNAEYQRKIAELTELTNDVDNLLASTDVGAIFLDSELKVRKFTPQIAERFNLLAQDVGRSIESFSHSVDYPDLFKDLKRVLQSGERIERDVLDRERNPFFLRILPYRAKGAVQGVVLTLIDVSGLKAAEDALFHERYLLNNLLSSIPDAIYFKDARGRFIRANQAAAAYYGLSDPSMLVGKTSFGWGDDEVAYSLHEADQEVLRTGEAQHYRLERLPEHGDGGGQWVVTTRLPLRDRTNRIVGVAVIRRDVTEQKLAEQKIKDSMNRRDQFLAMLSHELRNPLGAIVSAASLLKADDRPDNHAKLLELMDRQSKQMARLLDDLLEVSRVTQNRIELRRGLVDLGTVAREAGEAARSLMEARGVQFTMKIDARSLPVEGDTARLQQLQVNLLSNAAKYTPPGGHVVLEVGTEGMFGMIKVRDNGSGIPGHMLETIFELFVQSKHTLDRSDGGLGVGLTLVRSLVHMHGGTVTAYSEGVGRGAEFVVRLPLARAAAIEASPLPEPARPILRQGARVVIVEDNRDSRETLAQLLELAGLDCYAAEDGSKGLALIEEVCPDIAIIDVGLPGMDGFEVARRVRNSARNSDIVMMALTGYGQASDRALSKRAGFDEHLVKPIAPDSLLGLIAESSARRARGGPENPSAS